MSVFSHFLMQVSVCGASACCTVANPPTFYERLGAFSFALFNPIFSPINSLLTKVYEPWAQIVVLAFFFGTWAWVAFILKKGYVNLSCPYKTWVADLRFWTLVALLPHIFVYLYFN